MGHWIRLILIAVLLGSCTSTGPEPPPLQLVDSTIPRAAAGDPGWGFTQRAVVDLDRDGTLESAVLIANAEVRRGQPLWDDAQIWQVYIEEPSGERTYVFARWVQLGKLEMTITQDATILLVENAPSVFTVYEVQYRRPNEAIATELVRRHRIPSAFTL